MKLKHIFSEMIKKIPGLRFYEPKLVKISLKTKQKKTNKVRERSINK